MRCVNSKFRKKKLTIDTASTLQKTSQRLEKKRLATCAKYLLNCSVSYVLLGHIQSHALEKQFGIYWQGSGGIYLITVQNVFQKFKIDKTRKLLDKQLDLTVFPPTNHHCDKCDHHCDKCDHHCDKCELDVEFDMPICKNCEDQLPNECKQGLIYIPGFIAFKLPELHSILEETDTFGMFQKYGALISSLSRKRLREPSDNLVYFVIYCFFFIFEVTQVDKDSPSLCKGGLIVILLTVIVNFNCFFEVLKKFVAFWQTFFKTIIVKNTEDSGKECFIKQAKLSTSK